MVTARADHAFSGRNPPQARNPRARRHSVAIRWDCQRCRSALFCFQYTLSRTGVPHRRERQRRGNGARRGGDAGKLWTLVSSSETRPRWINGVADASFGGRESERGADVVRVGRRAAMIVIGMPACRQVGAQLLACGLQRP